MFRPILRATSGIVLVLLLSSEIPAVRAATAPFSDMSRSWYRYGESVDYLKDKGAIGGYPDGTFRPQATVNRAEFLKLLFRARASAEPVTGDCFIDVKQDDWFAPFVCAAARRGIVAGYPTGTGAVFKPAQPVVFAEAIKMALLAYGREIPAAAPGDQWYEPYALEIDRDGILSRSSYLPWDALTRERAADLIARFVRHDEDKISLRRSPGCGKPLPDPTTSVSVGGIPRTFHLTVPGTYEAQEPSPLIVAFHGRTNSSEQLRSYIGIDREAKEFFVAYPSAIRNDNGTFSWTPGTGTTASSLDLSFFDGLVENIANRYCIDMDRIFVVGHSLGAWMANSVACLRGGVVRASGTVAGDSIITDCTGPSASMIIHNPHDTLSPFSGAELARDQRLKENGCQVQSQPVQPDALKCQLYRDCDGGNTVTWCPHELDHDPRGVLYPHNWPREAAPAIVKFFRELR